MKQYLENLDSVIKSKISREEAKQIIADAKKEVDGSIIKTFKEKESEEIKKDVKFMSYENWDKAIVIIRNPEKDYK